MHVVEYMRGYGIFIQVGTKLQISSREGPKINFRQYQRKKEEFTLYFEMPGRGGGGAHFVPTPGSAHWGTLLKI